MDDSEILDLYFARSEAAIAETDLKYGHYCGTIAFRILHSRDDSDEIVNDTWMKAWNAIPPERPQILSAFLGTITRNLSLHRYEKEHAAKRGSGETAAALDELSEVLASNETTEEAAIRNVEDTELTDALNRFLGQLSETNRTVFLRRYWYLEPVKEIAESMESSEGKVKMSLLRTRKKLAEFLVREAEQA